MHTLVCCHMLFEQSRAFTAKLKKHIMIQLSKYTQGGTFAPQPLKSGKPHARSLTRYCSHTFLHTSPARSPLPRIIDLEVSPHMGGRLPRKEVIQPHLPVRLPCYDFTPITDPTLDACLPTRGLARRLQVLPTFVV